MPIDEIVAMSKEFDSEINMKEESEMPCLDTNGRYHQSKRDQGQLI